MDENMVNIASLAKEDFASQPEYYLDFGDETSLICQRLHDAGYRLDPYPNGKSKGELIRRIEELEAERDRARNLLREVTHPETVFKINAITAIEIRAFLAETSTVKS